MSKRKVMWLSEPTLGISLMLIKGGTIKQAEQTLERNGVLSTDSAPDEAKAFTQDIYPDNHKEGMTFKVVYYDGKSVKYLVHELVHLVTHIFRDRGILVSVENDEIFAYHMMYWFEVIIKELKVTELED